MDIIFYNHEVVQKKMLGHAIWLGLSPTSDQVKDLIGQFAVGNLCQIRGAINRNQDFLYKFKVTPIPKDINTSLTFAETAMLSAKELWQDCGDRTLCLFWSGGIDSTSALIALMQTNPQWRDQLRIYTSEWAIANEYPWFYQQFLQQADVVILKDQEFWNPEMFTADRLFINGHPAGPLWGIPQLLPHIPKSNWHLPYRNLFSQQTFLQRVHPAHRQITAEYIEKQVSKFPAPVETVADATWMLAFLHRWSFATLRWISGTRDITLVERYRGFYDNDHFQRWSLCTSEPKLAGTWNTYKQPAKDFIYEFTRDQDYRDNKLQCASLLNSIDPAVLDKNTKNRYILMTSQGYCCDISDYHLRDWISECTNWKMVT